MVGVDRGLCLKRVRPPLRFWDYNTIVQYTLQYCADELLIVEFHTSSCAPRLVCDLRRHVLLFSVHLSSGFCNASL